MAKKKLEVPKELRENLSVEFIEWFEAQMIPAIRKGLNKSFRHGWMQRGKADSELLSKARFPQKISEHIRYCIGLLDAVPEEEE